MKRKKIQKKSLVEAIEALGFTKSGMSEGVRRGQAAGSFVSFVRLCVPARVCVYSVTNQETYSSKSIMTELNPSTTLESLHQRNPADVGPGFAPGVVYCPDPFKSAQGTSWMEIVESSAVPSQL